MGERRLNHSGGGGGGGGGHGGHGWGGGGWGYPYGWPYPYGDVVAVVPTATKCKLLADVSYYDFRNKKIVVPAGTLLPYEEEGAYNVVTHNGYKIRVPATSCSIVQDTQLSADATPMSSDFADALVAQTAAQRQSQIIWGFAFVGAIVGGILAHKQGKKGMDFAITAMLGAGGGAIVGYIFRNFGAANVPATTPT